MTSAAVLTSTVAVERWREVGAAGLNPCWVGPGVLSHSPQMQWGRFTGVSKVSTSWGDTWRGRF